MRYQLMHKNRVVSDIDIDPDGIILSILRVHEPDHLPVGTMIDGRADLSALRDWWKGRSIPASRSGVRDLMSAAGISDTQSLLTVCMGLSLSDQYWVRPDEKLLWEDVNFFQNPFSADIGNLLFGQPVSGELDLSSPDNTSDGILRKRWTVSDGKRCLIKSGNEPAYQEPFNEIIATLLMEKQGIRCAHYDLIWIDGYPCSVCEDFVDIETEFVPASRILRNTSLSDGQTYRDIYVEFCNANGIDIQPFLDRMDLIDHVMMNTDRHHGNYGLIRNADTLEWICPAPVFDTGTSLMCRNLTEVIKNMLPTVNDDLRIENRLFQADLDWLDMDSLFDSLPAVSEILHSGFDKLGGIMQERAPFLISLLEKRMQGIDDMFL